MRSPIVGNRDAIHSQGVHEEQEQTRPGGHKAPTRPGNHTLAIERTGSTVVVKLTCVNEYGAIELYEHLIASAKAGKLNLEIKAAAP